MTCAVGWANYVSWVVYDFVKKILAEQYKSYNLIRNVVKMLLKQPYEWWHMQ